MVRDTAHDGAAWRQGMVAGAPSDFWNLTWGAGTFVGVGSSFSVVSTDGKSWSAPQTKDAAGGSLAGLRTVVFDGKQFIAYAGRTAYTSPDGATWTKRALAIWLDLAVFQDGVFFGTGGGKLLASQDGFVWTATHVFGPDETNRINGPRIAVGRVLR